jgi:SAM-dependent methyltransferase
VEGTARVTGASRRPEDVRGEALGSPYDTPELYDRIFEGLVFDIPYWLDVVRGGGGPALEVGCGTGRVLLRLLEQGLDVDGVDLSAPMVDRLRTKLAIRGLSTRIEVADMRDFTMPRRYARAFCPFNGFAHCDTVDDQLAALRCVREHLEPGGALVIHMSYPSPAYWAAPDGEPVLELEVPMEDGGRLQMWDTRAKDPVAQRQDSETELRRLDADGAVVASHRSRASQRWVYRYELEHLLRIAGFARWEILGDFAGEPLTHAGQQMLAWGWR